MLALTQPRAVPPRSATLSGSSVKEGDLLMLARIGGGGGADPGGAAPPQSHPMAVDGEGNVLNPQAMLEAIRGSADMMSQIERGNRPLYEAVRWVELMI